jgi:hypothetical protein
MDFGDFGSLERRQEAARIETDSKVHRVANKIENLADEMHSLRQKVEKLSLSCQAMWELIRDNTDLTEEELFVKMTEVDLRDGKLDGRLGQQVLICSNCGRKVSSKRSNCFYCGYMLAKNSAFE